MFAGGFNTVEAYLRFRLVLALSVAMLANGQRSAIVREIQAAPGPRSVVGWKWDYYVTGDKLFYRSGTAKATEPFRSVTVPSTAQKVAASDSQVYVWTDDGRQLLAFPVGPDGVAEPMTRLSPDDATAVAALNRKPEPPVRITSLQPTASVTLTPQRFLTANYNGDSVTAIDTSTNTAVGTLALATGAAPTDIVVSPNNYQAFTANNGCNPGCLDKGATILDPRSMTNTGFLTGRFPESVALNSDGSLVFVADDLGTFAANSVFVRVYNTANGASNPTIALPGSPQRIRLSPDGSTLYVVYSDDAYYPNDTASPVNGLTAIPVSTQSPTSYAFAPGSGCTALAVQPGTGQIFVMCNNGVRKTSPAIYDVAIASDGTISLINTFLTTRSFGLTFSPDGKKLYVSHFDAGTVEVLDPSSGSRLDLITTGSGPISITINNNGTRGYVTNYNANTVSVIDLTSDLSLATVTVGTAPIAGALTFIDSSVTAGTIGATVNGASFASNAAVSAGALVSIFGTNIGPATPAAAGAVPLPTTLGGISVTMAGKPAPLLYASAGQINCQVPFEVAGLSSAAVVVSNSATSSLPVNVGLATSSPGIFTATVNGFSQGAILNQNFTLNTPSNRAKVGEVVQIFATGQGPVTNQPASGAAAPASPTANSVNTPSVLIGNNQAVVQFSGLAPGFVGLWQVNAVVPVGTASGSAIPVQLILNGAPSNATTMSVQ